MNYKLVALFGILITYLLFALVFATLNITQWHFVGRIGCAIIMAVITIMYAGYELFEMQDKE